MKTECRVTLYRATLLSVLLAALFALAGCTNPEQAKIAHVEKGEVYLKDEKFQEASLEFRSAVQIDEKMASAHWGLARAYEGLQRFQEAFEELRKTTQLDPENLNARVKLGNYYIAAARGNSQMVAEADRLAKEILQKDPNHVEGHILMGSVLYAQNEHEKAFAEINHAIQLDPKRVDSYLSLARFYIVTNDRAKAEETFQRAISVNYNSGLAHTEYGKYLAQLARHADAEAELQKAVEVEPANRTSRFVLASFYLVNKQFDKAEVAYKGLAELDKDKPESKAVLADFYSSVNRLDEAIAIYQSILADSPDFTQGRYRLAEIMLMRGDTQGAMGQIDHVLAKDSHDRQALMLRARVRAQTGRSEDLLAAVEDLKEVLVQEPNSRPGLYFMAQANFNLGNMDQARGFAGDLERNYPDYLPAKLIQAQISLASGDSKNAYRQATELIERLNQTAPDRQNSPQMLAEIRAKAFLARGSAALDQRNTKGAREDFTMARDASPGDTFSHISLAGVALAEGKTDEAAAFYESALSVDSTNFNALSGLIRLYASKNDLGKAHARIDQALASNPNNASLHYLKAQIFGFERNSTQAEAALRKSLELDPNYIAAYSALGALFINTNQQERAIAEYQKILERRPDNATAHTLIGMLDDSRKNYDAAAESYRKALGKDQNAVIAANNLAWLYAVNGKGNLDEAVRLAQGVVQKNPNVPGFVDTLGWIYYKKGLYGPAVEQLQKAVELDERAAKNANSAPAANYRYHLGMALKARGDKEAAKRALEQAMRLSEKTPFAESDEARSALATL
ncbi:MAG TPA: tetratricopeptide repeat protein [Pyrinomonadaceae bacterium]|nr:tetratricopeptide repeat protein [Pyrinomonadaceae bacterium]